MMPPWIGTPCMSQGLSAFLRAPKRCFERGVVSEPKFQNWLMDTHTVRFWCQRWWLLRWISAGLISFSFGVSLIPSSLVSSYSRRTFVLSSRLSSVRIQKNIGWYVRAFNREFNSLINHNTPSQNLNHIYKMDCFGDFCLHCDAQTNGSIFCSQACRLSELDNFTQSTPNSPSYCDSKTIHRQSTGSNCGLFLPPAFDFSVYRVPSSSSMGSVKSTKPSRTQISEQSQNDLNDYVTSFDQTRTLRRRISMQSQESRRWYYLSVTHGMGIMEKGM